MTVRSVRLDAELEERIQRAAVAMGESVSDFIREAVAARADIALDAGPEVDVSDVLGVVHGGGGRARRTGAAFAEALGTAPAPRSSADDGRGV